MKVRLITALGIFIFGFPLLLLSAHIVYPIGLSLVSSISAWEFLRMFGMHKMMSLSIPSYIIAALMPFFSYRDFLPEGGAKDYILLMALVIFAFMLYLSFASVIAKGRFGFKNVAAVFMAITYVTVSFTSLSLLRYMENGVFLFALPFIGAWVCDSFAYFTGRLFGKHKLAPELSPKKTVEGSLGGILFAVIGYIVYGVIIESFCGMQANYLVLAVSGAVVAVVAQLGDLWASLIKREYGAKDYSNILPGHGGMMDRFDSIMAVSVVVIAICLMFPPFVAA